MRNLLLSGGERLVSVAEIVRGSGPKKKPYSILDVREALLSPINQIEVELNFLPSGAKPRGEAVFELTLHPAFLTKSYYPSALLRSIGLRDVGSKDKTIVPRKVTNARLEGKEHSTASLFIAGNIRGIEKFRECLMNVDASKAVQDKLITIESVNWIDPLSRLKGGLPSGVQKNSFEIAIHANSQEEDIVIGFQKFARALGAIVDLSRSIRAGGLTFLPVLATSEQMKQLL